MRINRACSEEGPARKQQQGEAVPSLEARFFFDVAGEYDALLAKQDILEQEIKVGARQIEGSTKGRETWGKRVKRK